MRTMFSGFERERLMENLRGARRKRQRLHLMMYFLLLLILGNPIKTEANEIIMRLGDPQYLINQEKKSFSVAPFTKNDSTLVPLRAISEMFNANVHWVPSAKQVLIDKDNRRIRVQIDNKKALVNGQTRQLLAPPILHKGTTMVPLRFIGESLETDVKFDSGKGEIVVKAKENVPPISEFSTDKNVYEVGERIQYIESSKDPDGDPIVDWIWKDKRDSFEAPGIYQVGLRVKDAKGLWSAEVIKNIEIVPFNEKPIALFRAGKNVVSQGEEVKYIDESHDPDGDGIVEVKWEGNEKVFFTSGVKEVSLQVKDSRGKWSDPYKIQIIVTEQVRLSELDYYLHNLSLGKIAPLGFNALDLPKVWPEKIDSGRTLILSNSPETFKNKGLLYSDITSGEVRLLYHHKNGTNERMKVMVLVENQSEFPNMVYLNRKGMSGPSFDELGVGRTGAYRYLASKDYWFKELKPREMVILSESETKSIPPGQSVYGLFDLTSTGPIKYHVVAVNEKDKVREIYSSLKTFDRDMHNRGTFPDAERVWKVNINGEEDVRLVLGDQIVDNYIQGWDVISNIPTTLKGNYGVLYKIVVSSPNPRGLVINPRGGNFAGALVVENHGTFMIPTSGFLNRNTHGIISGTITPNSTNQIEFVPPASSNMPVAFIFRTMSK